MTQDINLMYYGGSGGFFCLHLLLLTEKYNCIFDGDVQDFDIIFQKQWNITDVSNWKKSETWPHNNKTYNSTLPNKIYYKCNPTLEDTTRYPGKKIILYTDFDTQLCLAATKKASWFSQNETIEDHQNTWFLVLYNNIKDQSWPVCTSIDNFNSLPQFIKNECMSQPNFDTIFDQQKFTTMFWNQKKILYNNEYIFVDLKNTIDIDQADIKVKLQDLIKSKGQILFEQLGITGNKKTNNFVDTYIELHTPEQRYHLLK